MGNISTHKWYATFASVWANSLNGITRSATWKNRKGVKPKMTFSEAKLSTHMTWKNRRVKPKMTFSEAKLSTHMLGYMGIRHH
jgi:hypothetical protein